MEKDTTQEAVSARTKFLWVHGRSLWNEADASLSFDWSGTQICFRVHGSPAEVNMLASIGEDMLAVYANGCWQRKIGPSNGRKETHLLVRDVPEGCTIRIVKLSEPNVTSPVTIYDVMTRPRSLQDRVAPSICPCDFNGDRPGAESAMSFECVGDSDTSALYNVSTGDSGTTLDSNIEEGWPFFLTESLGVAPPMVVALSGVGVHAGPHRAESLSSYYQRLVCCWRHSQDSAPRVDTSEGSSTGGPLCVLVFVGGNDFVTMPRDSPSAQSLFMKDFVSAHQALLSVIRHRRPNSAIVSLYGDADSCSGCQSVAEQRFISSNMQEAIIRSVAGLGGAQNGFFSCMVQPNIRRQCRSDWRYDMHWGPTGHQKFAGGVKKALWALVLREGVKRKGENCFPGMASLAAMLSLSQQTIARRASADVALSDNVSAQGLPDKSTLHSVKDGGILEIAGMRARSWSALHLAAMQEDARQASALLEEDEQSLAAADSFVGSSGERTFSGLTPLHLAAFAGHVSVAGALLRSQVFAPYVNACAEEVDEGPWSALHVAATQGHATVAKCLLQCESLSHDLVNAVTGNGCTALHLACFARKEEVVQLLLDEDRFTAVDAATAWDADYDGDTALTTAIKMGYESIVCLLLRHSGFHAVDALCHHRHLPRGLDALELMAYNGMEEAAQLYLDVHVQHKPDVFVRCGALFKAAEGGHQRIIQILTTHPAVDTTAELAYVQLDQDGRAPNALHTASYYGHQRVVQRILQLNGSERAINAHCGKDKGTALHLAALKGHEDIASCLLQSSSFTEVNALDSAQRTALHVACEAKLEHVAVEIIRHPMFTEHRVLCSHGKSALMLAKELNLGLVTDALAQM